MSERNHWVTRSAWHCSRSTPAPPPGQNARSPCANSRWLSLSPRVSVGSSPPSNQRQPAQDCRAMAWAKLRLHRSRAGLLALIAIGLAHQVRQHLYGSANFGCDQCDRRPRRSALTTCYAPSIARLFQEPTASNLGISNRLPRPDLSKHRSPGKPMAVQSPPATKAQMRPRFDLPTFLVPAEQARHGRPSSETCSDEDHRRRKLICEIPAQA